MSESSVHRELRAASDQFGLEARELGAEGLDPLGQLGRATALRW